MNFSWLVHLTGMLYLWAPHWCFFHTILSSLFWAGTCSWIFINFYYLFLSSSCFCSSNIPLTLLWFLRKLNGCSWNKNGDNLIMINAVSTENCFHLNVLNFRISLFAPNEADTYGFVNPLYLLRPNLMKVN